MCVPLTVRHSSSIESLVSAPTDLLRMGSWDRKQLRYISVGGVGVENVPTQTCIHGTRNVCRFGCFSWKPWRLPSERNVFSLNGRSQGRGNTQRFLLWVSTIHRCVPMRSSSEEQSFVYVKLTDEERYKGICI